MPTLRDGGTRNHVLRMPSSLTRGGRCQHVELDDRESTIITDPRPGNVHGSSSGRYRGLPSYISYMSMLHHVLACVTPGVCRRKTTKQALSPGVVVPGQGLSGLILRSTCTESVVPMLRTHRKLHSRRRSNVWTGGPELWPAVAKGQ